MPCTFSRFERFVSELIFVNNLFDAGIRFTLTCGQGARGLIAKDIREAAFLLHSFSLPALPPSWRLTVSSITRNEKSPLVNMKTISNLENIMVKNQAVNQGYNDGLCLNSMGEVTETSSANFFLSTGQSVLTAPIKTGVLEGVMRQQVMDTLKKHDVDVKEQAFSLKSITNNTAAFVSNVIIGVQPISHIDGISLKSDLLIDSLVNRFYPTENSC